MMYHLRLVRRFVETSTSSELAYRANLWISLLHSAINLGTGILALVVLFGQVETIHGWSFPSTLALLGTFLTVNALYGLFIGPSLNALAGTDGEVWSGRLDFTLLRPVDIQFLASFRQWRPLALVDLALGLSVLGVAAFQLGGTLTPVRLFTFGLSLASGVLILYAILLAFTGLVFWSPGILFTWVFDSLFQLARYPVELYPGWLQLALTWIVPVGIMTTVPAQALAGDLSIGQLLGSVGLALLLFAGASILFRFGLRRYTSASS